MRSCSTCGRRRGRAIRACAWLPRKEFRQALSHAVDREAFANAVFLGAAVPITGRSRRATRAGSGPTSRATSSPRDKARETARRESASQNRDGDAWLEDAQGTEARFTVLTFRGNRALERGAAVLRDALRQVGVAIDIVPLEANAVRQRGRRRLRGRLHPFSATDLDPAMSTRFLAQLRAARISGNLGQRSPATDWERRIDTLMTQQAATLDRRRSAERLFNEVQRIFAENLPVLYFAAPRVYTAPARG